MSPEAAAKPNPVYRPLPRWLQITLIVAAGLGLIGSIVLVLLARSRGPADPSNSALNAVVVIAPLIVTFLATLVLIQPWIRHNPDGAERAIVRITGLIFPAAVFVLFMSLHTLASGGSMAVGLLRVLPMGLFFLGFGFVSQAFCRVGNEISCAKCGYAMDAEIQALDDPEQRCSECGAFWKRPGGIIRGHKVIRRWPFVVAALLVAAGIASTLGQPWLAARQLALLPTSSIIHQVTSTGGFTYDEWSVLSKRTLSPKQKLTLAEGLLAKRAKRQYLSDDEEAWFEAAVLNGELPRDLAERYFRGMPEVWIDVPDRAMRGRPLSIGLGSDHRGSLRTPGRTKLTVFVFFGGFRLAESGVPHTAPGEILARADRAHHGISFGRVRRAWGKLDRTAPGSGTPSPEIQVEPASPGPLRVSAEYWLVVMPPAAVPGSLVWGEDGALQIPAAAAWAERHVVEKTIEVVEP